MTRTLCALQMLASAVSAQAGDIVSHPVDPYMAVMRAQYAAHMPAVAQRPEESQRIYDAYLNSIGQRNKAKSSDSSVNSEDQPR